MLTIFAMIKWPGDYRIHTTYPSLEIAEFTTHDVFVCKLSVSGLCRLAMLRKYETCDVARLKCAWI